MIPSEGTNAGFLVFEVTVAAQQSSLSRGIVLASMKLAPFELASFEVHPSRIHEVQGSWDFILDEEFSISSANGDILVTVLHDFVPSTRPEKKPRASLCSSLWEPHIWLTWHQVSILRQKERTRKKKQVSERLRR